MQGTFVEGKGSGVRRAILLVGTMSAALVVASGAALGLDGFECGMGTCRGTPGDDVMIGTPADEGRHGVGGDDLIRGRGGNDSLTGGDGNDAVHGGSGDDSVEGNSGDDVVEGNSGTDSVEGNRGEDRVGGGTGDDLLFGGEGDDHLDGQDLGLTGIGGSDVLDCGPGSDTFSADFDDTVLRNCEVGVVGGF
jgi:Ca2+-binding RTX toxin-like protein